MVSKKTETVTFTFSSSIPMKQVCLVGNFNHWKIGADPMLKTSEGTFRRAKKLPPGRYEYKFFADGLFWDDPHAQEQAVNSFGTHNAVIKVGQNNQ